MSQKISKKYSSVFIKNMAGMICDTTSVMKKRYPTYIVKEVQKVLCYLFYLLVYLSDNLLFLHFIDKTVCLRVCAQLCPTLWDSKDCSLPDSSAHGILQNLARTLGQVAISYSRGFPDPGIKSMFPVSPALASVFFITEPPGKPDKTVITKIIVLN